MAEAVALYDDELITSVNDILMINPEMREIVIPETEKLFGVKFDVDVERKHFKCPKIVGDNIDLSQHKIYVVYQIVDEKGNVLSETPNPKMYWCEDMQTDETGDYITFSWQLSGNVFESSGIVGFKIVATYTDTETGNVKTIWNTIPAYGTVKMTLSNGEEITEQYADVITQLLQRMETLEKITLELKLDSKKDIYMYDIGRGTQENKVCYSGMIKRRNKMDIGKIEKGSIQIVGREGNRVYLQCLKKDVINLPKQEILSGSSCFVLDALDTENCLYVYNKVKNEEGQWYPL